MTGSCCGPTTSDPTEPLSAPPSGKSLIASPLHDSTTSPKKPETPLRASALACRAPLRRSRRLRISFVRSSVLPKHVMPESWRPLASSRPPSPNRQGCSIPPGRPVARGNPATRLSSPQTYNVAVTPVPSTMVAPFVRVKTCSLEPWLLASYAGRAWGSRQMTPPKRARPCRRPILWVHRPDRRHGRPTHRCGHRKKYL